MLSTQVMPRWQLFSSAANPFKFVAEQTKLFSNIKPTLLRTGHYLWPGEARREDGWVNKILWVEMGGLNKKSPSQGVGKVKIIKSRNTKIFVLFVLLRSNKYHLLCISICKVFHLNLP